MNLVRIVDSRFVPVLLPWFTPGNQTHEDIGLELMNDLDNRPDDILCLLAEEDGIGKAFLCAQFEGEFVWIWQARSTKGFKHSKIMFGFLEEWAKGKGAKTLRLDTDSKQRRKFYKRRYGFKRTENGMELSLC